MSTTPDRWTCPEPSCPTTVVAGHLTHDEAAAYLRRTQRRHALEHGRALRAQVSNSGHLARQEPRP